MGLAARHIGGLAVCLAAWSVFTPLHAGNASIIPPPLRERIFVFGGFDVSRGSSSVWFGFVSSPLQRMDQDGPLLRIMGGYGRYSYATSNVPGGVNDGEYGSGEFMLGWRHNFPNVIVSAYAGAHVESHSLAHADPGNPVSGAKAGVKGIVELFARPAPHWIMTASAALSSVYMSYSARAMLAFEINPVHALGFEAAILGNERYHEPRIGLALNTTIRGQILALSAGALDNSDKGAGAYFTMTLYAPF